MTRTLPRRAALVVAGVFVMAAGARAIAAPVSPAPTHVVVDGEVIYVPPGVTGWSIVSGTPPPEASPSASASASMSAPPSASPTPTAATAAPTSTATPTSSPVIPPSPSPVVTPSPTASPSSSVPPAPGDWILISRADLMLLPTSGSAWQGVLSQAAKTPDVDLGNLNSNGDVITLAKALEYARTGNAARRTEVIATLDRVRASGVNRALELARGLGAYVLAADLIGYRDAVFTSWVRAQKTRSVSGGPINLLDCAWVRPNNWGTWCRSSILIADLYLGVDIATGQSYGSGSNVVQGPSDLAAFRGYLGERAQYAGFKYGDLAWQADPAAPVGINPVGAMKSGHSIDGVVPDDQRRAGGFTWPPQCENYVAEALQGITLEATVLERAGHPAWQWSNQAIRRAVEFKYSNGCPFTGDDSSTPFVTDAAYGTSHAGSSPSQPGKGWGFGDWLFP